MQEITSIEDCSFQRDDQIVVALGFFDGIHRAHLRLIEECKTRANDRNGKSVVFTFQNHPSSVLTPSNPTPLLTAYPFKRQILESLNIDAVVAVPFDEKLCHTPAEDFIRDVLIGRIRARELVVGFNFHFGYKRRGSSEMLKTFVPASFEDVTVIEQQFHQDVPVSSSRIREVLAQGNIQETASLLGRPFTIAGNIVKGDGRGRTIGIPTANLDIIDQVLPPNGVYGVRVRFDTIDAESKWGVMNIGEVPTFTDRSRRTIEVHILDFDKEVYGQYLIAEVMQFIRNEKKFSGPQELIAQINNDINTFRTQVQSIT